MFEIQLFKIQQNEFNIICEERSKRHFCFPGLTKKLNLSMKSEKIKEIFEYKQIRKYI